MSARHCQGCTGYTGAITECPGMTMGEFETPDVVPSMRFADRIRALFGLPVFLGVTAEILPPDEGYPDGLDTSGLSAGGSPWPEGRDKELGL